MEIVQYVERKGLKRLNLSIKRRWEEKMENKEKLCEAEVRKNLVLVELGEPLTLPLAILNRSCKFKKEWDRIQNIWHGDTIEKIEAKAKQKAYYQTPEAKAKQKAYNQTPEAKAKQKAYNQTPEAKAKQKAYYQTPEAKAKQKAYYQNNREEILNKLRNHRDSQNVQEASSGAEKCMDEMFDRELNSSNLKSTDNKPKVVILDDNELSMACYANEYPENFKAISQNLNNTQKKDD